MGKAGIDDILAASGPSILPALLRDAWRFDGHACPEPVHLSDVENSALGRRRISIDVMISAVGDSYLVPKVITLQCRKFEKRVKSRSTLRIVREGEDEGDAEPTGGDDDNLACAHTDKDDGRWEHEIRDPEILIDFTRIPTSHLHKRLNVIANRLCRNATCTGVRTRQTVTAFLATPKARRWQSLSVNGQTVIRDETGRPFREKVLHYLGPLVGCSRSYRAVGIALPNPKSQEATAFVWSLQPLQEDYESFRIPPGAEQRFSPLMVQPGQDVTETLRAIARAVTDHITNIYGEHRERSLLGKLLVFHSVLQFRFDGEQLKRGWLEMLEVGDTGQGKTQQVDRLIQATGLGEGVDGVYSYQKLGDMWFLVWGKYPLNDGRLLFIDEAQNLQPEDIEKIRKGRSDGVISANGVKFGEHPSRTRLIACCNPKYQGVVDDQMFGIELVRQTFKDEDIRRFDFAIILSSSDDKADINSPRVQEVRTTEPITGQLLSDSVKWVWSRRAEQVEFTDAATIAVYDTAKVLAHLYGEARDVPLLLESDARHKIARIAVAIAGLVHSSDATHERIVVTPEHVEAVGNFLVEVYRHTNCSLDIYARIRREQASLSETEYGKIWEELTDCPVDGGSPLGSETLSTLLRAFMFHDGRIGRSDLAAELGKTPEWTSKVVRVLKSQRLIRVGRGRTGGYQATPKFTKFLKAAISKRALEP